MFRDWVRATVQHDAAFMGSERLPGQEVRLEYAGTRLHKSVSGGDSPSFYALQHIGWVAVRWGCVRGEG